MERSSRHLRGIHSEEASHLLRDTSVGIQTAYQRWRATKFGLYSPVAGALTS